MSNSLDKRSFLAIIAVTLLLIASIHIYFNETPQKATPYFLDDLDPWVDTALSKMSLDEKIGQLFLLELNNANTSIKEEIDTLNQKLFIGGLKFKQTEVLTQLIITNYIQSKTKHPLFIGSEGNLINRNDFHLPFGPIINSIQDSLFTDYYFNHFAKILKYENVNIEFSNTINKLDGINNSFSDKDSTVKKQSEKFKEILHKNKIISGLNFNDSLFFYNDSTKIDSLAQDIRKYNIDQYIALQISPDVTRKIAINQVPYKLDKFNQKAYGFRGLIFCQVEENMSSEEFANVFLSGTDVFIINKNVHQNIASFKSLIENKLISISDIDNKVKRILKAKKWAGIEAPTFKSAEISMSKIIEEQRVLLSWRLYENSFVLLKNDKNILPFEDLIYSNVHVISIGKKTETFNEYLFNYMDFSASEYSKNKLNNSSIKQCKNLILSIADDTICNDTNFIKKLKQLEKTKNILVVNFGNYKNIEKLKFADVILHAYDDHPFAQTTMAQAMVGAIRPKGEIVPSSIAKEFKPVNFRKINRFKYTIPEAAGYDSQKLKGIDSLIELAINAGAMPGGQVLAAQNGKVFYYKSFGHHTYSKFRKVKNSDIYDLASISKVAATTLTAMKLYEMDSIGMHDSIKYYIDDTINCTIKNHQIADFFIHQTGLPADMPILPYINYRDSATKRYDKYFSPKKDSVHTIKVADEFYLREDYIDSVTASLYNLEIDTTKAYQYSDINFNIIYDILLKKLPKPYKSFVYNNFYKPLQLRTIGYLPIERFNKRRIPPTQKDKYWRKQLVQGYPHDESAALYGGISGNAGLFSNANDLAILFQALNNGGVYAGKRIMNKETIQKFILPQHNSKRGLGFARKKGMFGHSGFTGCVVWANPQTNFVFVFLSNSIHPKPTNRKLKRMKIRNKVLNIIMDSYIPHSTKLSIASLN